MKYLAIDYGGKRVGFALCDPDEIILSPLCQLESDSRHPEKLIDQIIRLLGEHEAQAVIIGLPLNMDDSEGPQSKQTRVFANSLRKRIDLPMYWQDERLSSAAADEKLREVKMTSQKQKEKRDMLAACEILRDFLESKNSSPPLEEIQAPSEKTP